jgi:hypothetical protein
MSRSSISWHIGLLVGSSSPALSIAPSPKEWLALVGSTVACIAGLSLTKKACRPAPHVVEHLPTSTPAAGSEQLQPLQVIGVNSIRPRLSATDYAPRACGAMGWVVLMVVSPWSPSSADVTTIRCPRPSVPQGGAGLDRGLFRHGDEPATTSASRVPWDAVRPIMIRQRGRVITQRGGFRADRVRAGFHRQRVENPKPGNEGTITSNAWAGSPPWAPGSARGSMTLAQCQNVQGQPWRGPNQPPDRRRAIHHPQDRQRPRLKDPGQARGRRSRRGGRDRPPARSGRVMTTRRAWLRFLGVATDAADQSATSSVTSRWQRRPRHPTDLATRCSPGRVDASPRSNALYDRCAAAICARE